MTDSKCKIYKNVAYVHEYLKLGVPINIAIVKHIELNEKFYIGPLIRQENNLYMLKIDIVKSINYKWEFTYHKITMSNNPIEIMENYSGGLLLPEIGTLDKSMAMTYAIVTTEI